MPSRVRSQKGRQSGCAIIIVVRTKDEKEDSPNSVPGNCFALQQFLSFFTFYSKILFLSDLYTGPGAQTHNSVIESRRLQRHSQPNAPQAISSWSWQISDLKLGFRNLEFCVNLEICMKYPGLFFLDRQNQNKK